MADNIEPEYLTLKQAVEVSGKSIATLRRKKTELESFGAICSKDGWKVTVEQLEKAGLMKKSSRKTTVVGKKPVRTVKEKTVPVDMLKAKYEEQIQQLKELVEYERNRANKAEQRLDKVLDTLTENYVIKKKLSNKIKTIFNK